jgi:hypothetical protein
MKLRELAHARAGDKGNVSNIAVIAHEPGDYAFLAEHVTAERVRAHFAEFVKGRVERYELPALGALNFVLHEALGGGVTRSLSLDPHGKSLSSSLLDMEIPDRQREPGRCRRITRDPGSP